MSKGGSVNEEDKQIKCFFCSMEELSLKSKIQDLEVKNERLELEIKEFRRILSRQRRERNKEEMSRQQELMAVK